jgi:hypothetical protein
MLIQILFLCVSFAETRSSQAKSPQHTQNAARRHSSSNEADSIAELADGVPAEYAADILIRVAESAKIASREKRIALLRKAFTQASRAQMPVQPAATPYSDIDTRSGYLAMAATAHLDRLSLQSHIVTSMLPIDPASARELLQQLEFPTLPPVSCEEPLTYNLSTFYRMLEEVEKNGFTERERRQGQHVALLVPYLTSVQSHAQITPIAELLRKVEMSPSELEQLAGLFADSISRLKGDTRSFTAERLGLGGYQFPEALVLLIKRLNAQQVQTGALLNAIRGYLTNNLNAVQCGETASEEKHDESVPDCVLRFNEELKQQLSNYQLLPIRKDELSNSKIGQRAKIMAFWNSPESKKLREDLRRLRFGNGNGELSQQERSTSHWNLLLIDFLTELASWDGTGDDETDVFNQKCILYSTLIQIVPSDTQATKVTEEFVDFLELNSAQMHSPAEWMFWVNILISGAKAPLRRQELIHAFLNSRDPALSLYARVELWDPRHL